MRKLRILLTTGDPNGIGPEIILKIYNSTVSKKYDIYVAGIKEVFDFYSRKLKIKNIPKGKLYRLKNNYNFIPKPGSKNKTAGRIAGDSILFGTILYHCRKIDAIVTMPVSKETLNAGGYFYEGHTDMLQELTQSENAVMLMISGEIKIGLLTIHKSLNTLSDELTVSKIIDTVLTYHNVLKSDFCISEPVLSLLCINPHCGDNGVIGREDNQLLHPAVKKLKKLNINISGPFSPDGYFGRKLYKKFDLTIASYHDQGLIPFKILSKGIGVNYTGGMDLIRTSPEHGTGFDIAGKGIADIQSSIEAIKFSATVIKNRKLC